jgi:hypothetical protein
LVGIGQGVKGLTVYIQTKIQRNRATNILSLLYVYKDVLIYRTNENEITALRRNISPPSSGSKSRPNKTEAEAGTKLNSELFIITTVRIANSTYCIVDYFSNE